MIQLTIYLCKKKDQMEESIPVRAASRYAKVIEGYKARLKKNPDLKLSEYCKETHTNYNGVVDWTKRHAVSIRELRREARGESTGIPSGLGPSGTFIQFVPSRRPASGDLRGVSITFPDGVNLTLQESSVESVISLLTIYQSRQGGASSCSL